MQSVAIRNKLSFAEVAHVLRPFAVDANEEVLRQLYCRSSDETGLTFSQLQARTLDFFDTLEGKPRPTTPEKKMELGGQFLGCRRITAPTCRIANLLKGCASSPAFATPFESRWVTKTMLVKPKPGLCGNVR